MVMNHLWQGTWHGRSPTGDQHSRSREVVRPTGGIVRGKFPSRKNGRMVHHEGLLELDAIYLFETSPKILRYREQLAPIHYPDGARLRRYTPDFELVLYTGEVVVVEVKPSRSLADEEIGHKVSCIQGYYQRLGHPFVVLTEKTLRQEPRQSNLRWLYHQTSRIPPTYSAIRMAVEDIYTQLPATISKTKALLAPRSVDPFSALLAGILHCPLDLPVALDSTVDLFREDGHEWFFIAPGFGF